MAEMTDKSNALGLKPAKVVMTIFMNFTHIKCSINGQEPNSRLGLSALYCEGIHSKNGSIAISLRENRSPAAF